MHDQLTEARSVARARAEEDFEFFVNTVLGLGWAPELCESIQRALATEGPTVFQGRLPGRQEVITLWLFTVRGNVLAQSSPSETFSWLFADKIERAA